MTYNYKCEVHGEFSVVRSMKDKPLKCCEIPGCKGKIVQVFNSPMVNLSFKGSYNSTRKDI